MTIDHPQEWKVNLRDESCFEHGGFDVMEPDGRAIVTVLWRSKGQLMKAVRKKKRLFGFFSKPAVKEMPETISSLDVHKEMLWHRLRENAKGVELLSSEEVEVNGHKAYLEKVVFKPTFRFLLSKRMGGKIKRIQLLLICHETARAFAIFGSTLGPDFTEFEDVLNGTVLSFKCHV